MGSHSPIYQQRRACHSRMLKSWCGQLATSVRRSISEWLLFPTRRRTWRSIGVLGSYLATRQPDAWAASDAASIVASRWRPGQSEGRKRDHLFRHLRQSRSNWPKDGEPACRRGSVHSLAGARWPSICAAYLRTAQSPGRTGRPHPLLGLAPGGVYLAAPVARSAGALLPHRCTLACAVSGHRRSVLCGTFLRVAPTRCASTLPCGAPTFLDAEAPRPPGRLTVQAQSDTDRIAARRAESVGSVTT